MPINSKERLNSIQYQTLLLSKEPSYVEDHPQSKHMKMRKNYKKRLFVIFSCVVLISICVYCFYVIRKLPEFKQYDLVRSYHNPHVDESTEIRTILLWNAFFGDKRWSLPDDTLGPSYFRDDLHCPVFQCELTNNHEYLPADYMFDAILFHTAEPFPIFKSMPKQKSPHQVYVFASMEPPGETKHILNDEIGFYNWTMTYRLDSDIIWPYICLIEKASGQFVAPQKYPKWKEPPAKWNDSVIWNLWSSKNKSVAWFVSHCETLSLRENLAHELQRYINVDIYGKCGNLSCPRHSSICDELLDTTYKFYLSFENSLCIDYVTEKLYNILKRNVIPIVYGGANYTRFMPPHSYINVEDYSSVEELANYLHYLETHPVEYMRYFWWRSVYDLDYYSPFCDLCEKLHATNFEEKTQTYQNIEKWWLHHACHFSPKIVF